MDENVIIPNIHRKRPPHPGRLSKNPVPVPNVDLCQIPKWRLIFWTIILVLTVLTINDVISLVKEYIEDPKLSKMSMMFNESIEMPNITFCMPRSLAWSHNVLDTNETSTEWDRKIDEQLANLSNRIEFLSRPWDFRMAMEVYEVVATLNSLERETSPQGMARSVWNYRMNPRLHQKRTMITKWLEVIKARNTTFEELTNKVGRETLRKTIRRFKRSTYNDDNDKIATNLRISWISTMQMCFQPIFQKDSFVPIVDQGLFFTMLMEHNNETLADTQHECMSVDMHGRASSMNRFMEGKGRTKDGFTDSVFRSRQNGNFVHLKLCASQRSQVTVSIKAVYDMLENNDTAIACSIKNDKRETEFNCRSRCRMEMIERMCSCTANTLAHLQKIDKFDQFPLCDYRQCMFDRNVNHSDQTCSKSCSRDCHQLRYHLDVDNEGLMTNRQLSLVNLHWGSFEYLLLQQERVWSVTTFIAALGGCIGMWLGLSILTLIEGCSFMFSYLRKKLRQPTLWTENDQSGMDTGKLSTIVVNEHVSE